MISVPGFGNVPVIWRPAVLGADASYGRQGLRILAIVHHRMVGTLPGTISTFTQGAQNRPVSTTFGVGYIAGKLTIAQFVDLRDTAFGNGNYDATGLWDASYPVTAINARTVSIEHEDGATANRGVVREGVIAASIELDRLLLSGDPTKIRAAGIRATGAGGLKAVTDLGSIRPGPTTIIDHNFIAGRLKPFCWRRWLDGAGFPQARYIAALTGTPAPTPTPEDTVRSFTISDRPLLATVKAGTWLYTSDALAPAAGNIQINPTARDLPYIGLLPGPVRMVGYVDAAGVRGKKAYFIRDADVAGYKVVAIADPAAVALATKAATLAGRRAEWDRQSTGARVTLLPKP